MIKKDLSKKIFGIEHLQTEYTEFNIQMKQEFKIIYYI